METTERYVMSLYEAAMEDSVIIDKKTVPDGYGGFKTIYTEGAPIDVAYSFDASTQARIAAQEGVKNRYTLTTKKSVVLQFPDIVKRVRDGKYFQITSDGKDNLTPPSSSLDIRQVEAEEWEMPNE